MEGWLVRLLLTSVDMIRGDPPKSPIDVSTVRGSSFIRHVSIVMSHCSAFYRMSPSSYSAGLVAPNVVVVNLERGPLTERFIKVMNIMHTCLHTYLSTYTHTCIIYI